MKSSAHTIFVMTTTLPHAPTLYWNYLLGYEIRPTDHFWHWPHPSTHFVLCIMYYFVRSHHLYHDNDPTPLPHLVLELCIILWKWTTNTPLSPHLCQLPFNLYWNYVLCYELFSDIMLLNWPQRSLLSWRHRNDTTLVLELGIMLWNWAQRSFYIKYHQYHPLSDNTITIHHVLCFEILI